MVATPSTMKRVNQAALATQATAALTAAGVSPEAAALVSGNAALAASAAVYAQGTTHKISQEADRHSIAQAWQHEAYRQVHLCGEARYAVSLFAATAGRAELGISEPQTLITKPKWLETGPEVEALAILAPTVRERTKLIRDYMTHRVIAGECYLIARTRQPTDPGYIVPPEEFETWEDATRAALDAADVLDPDFDPEELDEDPNEPIWEIVGVTEIQKAGDGTWSVRHDNDNFIALTKGDPVIRLWHADPEKRREAWSPFRSLLGTLREIEWLTMHIFTQVQSSLMNAGVWFLPDNLTFPPPPPDSVQGGEETIALMNEAQKFMASLAASTMRLMNPDEVSFPSVVMADPLALDAVSQDKLIKFWSEINDTAMTLRDSALRRFANGMDMPGGKVIEANGTGSAGGSNSGGVTNHWGEWAKQEQTINNHVEPALDDFVQTITTSYLRSLVPNTKQVIGYGTANMRHRQDRSKEALELNARGLLNNATTLRETGFDPSTDMMGDEEFKRWVLVKMIGGSPTPEQVTEAVNMLGILFNPPPPPVSGNGEPADGRPGRHLPGNTDDIEVQGPPEGDHEHRDAPYSALMASCEVLVLRALEKKGNVLLNSGKRGKDRDRTTPPHLAHLSVRPDHTLIGAEFDFGLAETALEGLAVGGFDGITAKMGRYCADLYNSGREYTREGLIEALSA